MGWWPTSSPHRNGDCRAQRIPSPGSMAQLAEAAQLLGKEDDAREYSVLHQRIKEAYIAEFVEQDGRLRPDRQASYVRALAFDLLPEHLCASTVQRLVELVQSADMHVGTGF